MLLGTKKKTTPVHFSHFLEGVETSLLISWSHEGLVQFSGSLRFPLNSADWMETCSSSFSKWSHFCAERFDAGLMDGTLSLRSLWGKPVRLSCTSSCLMVLFCPTICPEPQSTERSNCLFLWRTATCWLSAFYLRVPDIIFISLPSESSCLLHWGLNLDSVRKALHLH